MISFDHEHEYRYAEEKFFCDCGYEVSGKEMTQKNCKDSIRAEGWDAACKWVVSPLDIEKLRMCYEANPYK